MLCLEHDFIWFRDLDTKKIGAEVSFEMWCWRRMVKIKWLEKGTNEEVIKHIGEDISK